MRGKTSMRQDLGHDVSLRKVEVRKAAGSRGQVLQDAPHIPLKQGLVLEGGVEEGVAEVVFTLM